MEQNGAVTRLPVSQVKGNLLTAQRGRVDSGERLVYDGQHMALSFDDSGSLTNRYLNGPAVDQVFASEDGAGDVLWGLADDLGTIRDIAAYDAVNDITSVINHIQYDSFGNITSETDPQTSQAPTQGSVLNGDFRFSFTGREYDPETGQYYYRRRYYDPATGRFDNEDPLSFAAGDTNLQRYVFNSPTNYTDPSGLQVGFGGGDATVPSYPIFNDTFRQTIKKVNDLQKSVTDKGTYQGNLPNGDPYEFKLFIYDRRIGQFRVQHKDLSLTGSTSLKDGAFKLEVEQELPNDAKLKANVDLKKGERTKCGCAV